eukprot:CCRYP_018206-RA/>CCRYP_018206-RA protein AED:0.26 eAED:0.34 QI:0/0/0/1/0/0/3/0/238
MVFANPPGTSSITYLTTLGPKGLFVGKSMVVVVYVDGLLLLILRLILSFPASRLLAFVFVGNAKDFLVWILYVPPPRLVPRSLSSKLDSPNASLKPSLQHLSSPIGNPAKTSPLPKDAAGNLASGSFNYAAAIGMLLYLSGHSSPDIAFVVHQCAWYTFHPTRRHKLAFIHIGWYLKRTMDKGLIMSPSSQPRVDCYPDTDFAGLYGHEDSLDPHCTHSRTVYVILAFGCPVIWRSHL